MLKDLLAAMPVTGRRVRMKNEQERVWLFPVEQLHVGDVVRVLPGERIPVDGVIVKGSSSITSNVIARISVMKNKNVGDVVECGTINYSSVIDVKVTSEFHQSTLQNKINRLQLKRNREGFWQRLLQGFSVAEGNNI